MHTTNSITINGPLEAVFRCAAEVERWPEILPHYRSVDVLEDGTRRLVRMQCVRSFGPIRWPCRWTARQEIQPEQSRILFEHVAGPAKGMLVEWQLRQNGKGVVTTIVHQMDSSNPFRKIFTDGIVGPLFVEAIAGKTLSRIKQFVEDGEAK